MLVSPHYFLWQFIKEFELDGRSFVAVSPLLPGQSEVLGIKAMQYVHAFGLRPAEDRAFLWQHRHKIPAELHNYWLVTNRAHDPIFFVFLWGLGRMEGEDWRGNAFGLSTPWRKDVLILLDPSLPKRVREWTSSGP